MSNVFFRGFSLKSNAGGNTMLSEHEIILDGGNSMFPYLTALLEVIDLIKDETSIKRLYYLAARLYRKEIKE